MFPQSSIQAADRVQLHADSIRSSSGGVPTRLLPQRLSTMTSKKAYMPGEARKSTTHEHTHSFWCICCRHHVSLLRLRTTVSQVEVSDETTRRDVTLARFPLLFSDHYFVDSGILCEATNSTCICSGSKNPGIVSHRKIARRRHFPSR
jgi:hypothetical protein